MKVTHSADLPEISLPNSALTGVQLTHEKDHKNFTVFEARIPAKASVPLRSADDKKNVHFYYCISGDGKLLGIGDEEINLNPDTVVALSSDVTYELMVSEEGGMRLFVVYYPDVGFAYRSLAVVRSLSELIGTDRDIDWERGHSRRFLIEQDGFPLSINNTQVYPKTSTKLGYLNHIESVYYISGRVTYRWQDTSGEWVHENSRVDEGNGTNYLMNMHDCHVLKNHDQDSYCICIFDPVLTGNENHQHTEDGYSGYQD